MEKMIKNESDGRYLLLKTGEQEETYEDIMLKSLGSGGFLIPMAVYENGYRFSRFKVNGLRSLNEYLYNRELAFEEMSDYLIQLGHAVDALGNYLLNENNMIVEEGTVFISEENHKLYFCIDKCGKSRNFQEGLRYFSGELIAHADKNDPKTMKFALSLYKTVREKGIHMYDVMDVIMAERRGSRERIEDRKPEERQEVIREICKTDSTGRSIKDRMIEYEKEENDLEEFKDQFLEMPEEKGIVKPLVIKLFIAVGIMILALLVIFVIRGAGVVKRVLPIFGILTICAAAYMAIEMIVENKKKKAESFAV